MRQSKIGSFIVAFYVLFTSGCQEEVSLTDVQARESSEASTSIQDPVLMGVFDFGDDACLAVVSEDDPLALDVSALAESEGSQSVLTEDEVVRYSEQPGDRASIDRFCTQEELASLRDSVDKQAQDEVLVALGMEAQSDQLALAGPGARSFFRIALKASGCSGAYLLAKKLACEIVAPAWDSTIVGTGFKAAVAGAVSVFGFLNGNSKDLRTGTKAAEERLVRFQTARAVAARKRAEAARKAADKLRRINAAKELGRETAIELAQVLSEAKARPQDLKIPRGASAKTISLWKEEAIRHLTEESANYAAAAARYKARADSLEYSVSMMRNAAAYHHCGSSNHFMNLSSNCVGAGKGSRVPKKCLGMAFVTEAILAAKREAESSGGWTSWCGRN